MSDAIWIATGLFLILEGIGPMLIPHRWKRYLHQVSASSANQLRRMGGIMVVVGAIVLYFSVRA